MRLKQKACTTLWKEEERKVIVGDAEKEDSMNKGCAHCRLKKGCQK